MNKTTLTHKFTKGLHLFFIAALLAGLAVIGAPVPVAHAAGITVDTTADAVDANSGNCAGMTIADLPGADNVTSLREAICAANNTAGADTILFDSSIDGTPIVLNIAGSSNEDLNADGDLDITDAAGLTITGNGETKTIIDGNNDERVLHVLAGDLTITGLTIRNGDETAAPSTGGGIKAVGGDLTIDQCTFADNKSGQPGGGIYYTKTGGTLRLTNSTFTGNEATGGSSGAFYVSGTAAALFMDGCTITGNKAKYGGGINFHATSGTADISNSVISGNTATSTNGGGIYYSATSGTMTIRNSEISNNVATTSGGGIDHNATEGILTIINSTFSGNRANTHGGGISNNGSNATINLNFVTITNNIADDDADGSGEGGGIDITWQHSTSTVNIQNSIVQGNDDETPTPATDDCGNSGGVGTYVSNGGNVFGSGTGCPVGATDTTGPANLGPLQNNGGPTQTHALLVGSPAIDGTLDCTTIAGDPVTDDQRGVSRPQPTGGNCDIGAYELEQQPPVPVGGIVVPVNKLGLLVPWLGLAALAGLAALGVVVVRRRRGA